MNARRRDNLHNLPPFLREIIGDGFRTLIARAWCVASREERRLRMRTVTALILELDRIRQADRFATGLAEGVIEEIIEGDWRGARDGLAIFTFAHEAPDLRDRYAPIWQTFCHILEAALAEHAALERGEGAN